MIPIKTPGTGKTKPDEFSGFIHFHTVSNRPVPTGGANGQGFVEFHARPIMMRPQEIIPG